MPLSKRIGLTVKITVSAAIILMLLTRMRMDVLSDMAGHITLSSVAVAVALVAAQAVLLTLRWRLLVNIGRRCVNAVQALQINLTAQLANLVFITSIGGVVARIALSVPYGVTVTKSVVAAVFDRIMTLSALILIAALFLPGVGQYTGNGPSQAAAFYISGSVVALFILTPAFLHFVFLPWLSRKNLKGRVSYCVRYARLLVGKPFRLLKIIALSLFAQSFFFLSVISLSGAFGIDLTLVQIMTVLPVISLVAGLPVGIGGWGIREGAFVYGFGLLGVPTETAFLISIGVGLTGMFTTALLGLPALFCSNFRTVNKAAQG